MGLLKIDGVITLKFRSLIVYYHLFFIQIYAIRMIIWFFWRIFFLIDEFLFLSFCLRFSNELASILHRDCSMLFQVHSMWAVDLLPTLIFQSLMNIWNNTCCTSSSSNIFSARTVGSFTKIPFNKTFGIIKGLRSAYVGAFWS